MVLEMRNHIVTCRVVHVTKMKGSSLDFISTINYNRS
jgi:hypothetical protein